MNSMTPSTIGGLSLTMSQNLELHGFFHVPVKRGCLFLKSITNVIMVSIKNIDNKNTDQADTVNPFDRDVSLRPGNLYANLVLAESEQVSYYK